jgi:hypothetical protein
MGAMVLWTKSGQAKPGQGAQGGNDCLASLRTAKNRVEYRSSRSILIREALVCALPCIEAVGRDILIFKENRDD